MRIKELLNRFFKRPVLSEHLCIANSYKDSIAVRDFIKERTLANKPHGIRVLVEYVDRKDDMLGEVRLYKGNKLLDRAVLKINDVGLIYWGFI